MVNAIAGIGYNPMTIGLGNIGLGTSGMYSDYSSTMPSTMGMTNPYGLGMMGMYNPQYMTQYMTQLQGAYHNMELENLRHVGRMHNGMVYNEANAYGDTDRALITKMLNNSSVHQLVDVLYNVVKSGDQDAICETYDSLKQQIFHTYGDELARRGTKENPDTAATRIIENLYAQIATAHNNGKVSNLRDDIISEGDAELKNGFMQVFRIGHNEKNIYETLNHIYGERINHKGSKDFREAVGECAGRVASAGEKALYGGGIAATTTAVGYGIIKAFGATFKKCNWARNLKFNWNRIGQVGFIAAGVAAVADIIWKCTRDDK